ncbi:MAG: protein translocase subunit SecF [Methanocalculus sp. MSAO_Arc1]|uniref:protein translocase subunit SecF n=1 Tax=Methanocalculus TaxID=71151 RepID=UPI000FF59C27|nr:MULTISPECIES: protein translocase subunit SecF [unclassified Methanocalculus]RQD80190.1 MAG: protein translocase subunit SecF [Methanocalculus sp. MSAO_Arc1]
MGFDLYDLVNKYPPKQMMTVPLIIALVALAIVGLNYMMFGVPVNLGIDFAGGTAVTTTTDDTVAEIESYFAEYPLISVGEGLNRGTYIRFGPMDDDQFRALTRDINARYPDAKVDQIGETFGQTLQQQALLALLFSFIGMSIIVFIAFRTIVPSIAVVFAAFTDILITAAIMDLLNIPLTLGTTAALLMLIGYSVDSDILLTTRILKRQGKLEDKLRNAFRTGFIMTTTTLSAVIALLVVAWIGQIEIIFQIATVLVIGLIIDLINTWMFNAGLLKWYVQSGKAARGVSR